MTDEEKRFMQNFCIGLALVLTAVILMLIVHSCEGRKPISPRIENPIIGLEQSLSAFCYNPYVGSGVPYVWSK
jgi:hypothetical protein